MKRDARLYITVLFLAMFAISFVAAQEASLIQDASRFTNDVFEILKPLLGVLIGEETPSGFDGSLSSDVISRIMFFILIFALVHRVILQIEFFRGNQFVIWTVSIAVSVLATRWLGDGGLVQTILLPYNVLGVSLSAFLPLLIYFYFVEFGFTNKVMRKIAWIFFAVMYIFLWIGRYDQIATSNVNYIGWVYPISALLCLCFFWFDGTIQKWRRRAQLSKAKDGSSKRILYHLEHEKDKLEDLYRAALLRGDDSKANQYRADIEAKNTVIINLEGKK
jgi:hypothetical protein